MKAIPATRAGSRNAQGAPPNTREDSHVRHVFRKWFVATLKSKTDVTPVSM